MLGVHKFCDEEWGRPVSDGDAETEQKSAHDEHGNVEAHREQSDSNEHYGATDNYSHAAAEDISTVRNDRDGEH